MPFVWAWQQRGGAAAGGRDAQDDNAVAGAAPANAHDAQGTVPGPRRLRYVCGCLHAIAMFSETREIVGWVGVKLLDGISVKGINETKCPTSIILYIKYKKQNAHTTYTYSPAVPKHIYIAHTHTAGIEPQACARKPFQVPTFAPGVSAHRAYPPRFCSAVVPHALHATPLRPCDSLRVPYSSPPHTPSSPLPRNAWCVALGSLASCRPIRRRRIPSCSKLPHAFL
jgi:hypothetical protein